MLNKIPKKFEKTWFLILLIMTFVLWACMSIIRWVFLPSSINSTTLLGMFIISFSVSLIAAVFGYMGATTTYLLSSVSIVIGIILMVITYSKKTGWEDLVSMLQFLMVFALGVGSGLVAELIIFINKRKK